MLLGMPEIRAPEFWLLGEVTWPVPLEVCAPAAIVIIASAAALTANLNRDAPFRLNVVSVDNAPPHAAVSRRQQPNRAFATGMPGDRR